MGEQDSDQALVLRVQKGDKRAFDLLVRKYQHKVIGIISRYISDWSECQDVAQEAFIRAYRAIAAFRGDSQFYTWMYKIATNTAKNHLVSMGRRPPTDDIEIEDAMLIDGGSRLKDRATP
ncbi:MAG TPA: sigma-70 family RNA polymerase sigma factor, partial [Rudaea sp.]|nr:sigma-70 family RNA polymerase sigma factor [Rudaea sp.]